ncbi:MAG: bifunctional phosphoglucose/phosphomannose isomerase [Dehalococcoidia bacterium]
MTLASARQRSRSRGGTFVLDREETYELDESGMFEHIRTVGWELSRAWAATEAMDLDRMPTDVRSLVVAGIGGSATAGDYLAAVCRETSPIPVEVAQGFRLPSWAGKGSIVVACSYSGRTDETLEAYREARRRGASLAAITSGGTLAEEAVGDGWPVWQIAYTAPPRATTVHTLAPLFRIAARLGLVPGSGEIVSQAAAAHSRIVESALSPDVPVVANEAKQLAMALVGRRPIVIGGEHLASAAVRFKNQLAENGKTLSSAEALPEAGHNLVVGLSTARAHARTTALVTLESPKVHPAVRARFAAVVEQFAAAGIPVHRIEIDGGGTLADLLVATAWGDYVSCYLAMATGFDPTPIPQIDAIRAAGKQAPG